MDTLELVTFIIVTMFCLVIINVFINFQTAGAIESVEYSSTTFGNSLKSQSYALHLLNEDENNEYGVFDESTFQELAGNCAIHDDADLKDNSPYNFGGSNIETKIETSFNSCDNPKHIQNPVILGVVVDSEGQKVEKTVIR